MELVGEALVLDMGFSFVVHLLVYLEGMGIGRLLRIWIIPVIRCLFLLVGLFLIGLGLGDSRLVILSLLSLALFLFVINLWIGFLFSFFFISFLYFLGLLYVFHA